MLEISLEKRVFFGYGEDLDGGVWVQDGKFKVWKAGGGGALEWVLKETFEVLDDLSCSKRGFE